MVSILAGPCERSLRARAWVAAQLRGCAPTYLGEILGGGRVCGEIESMVRAPSIGPGFDFIFVISYPTTPARGVTSWSGAYQADFIPPSPHSSPWTGDRNGQLRTFLWRL